MKIAGVKIGEYESEETLEAKKDRNRTTGWIEPDCENPQWILWFTKSGDAVLYTEREPSGAVKGEPVLIKASTGRVANFI